MFPTAPGRPTPAAAALSVPAGTATPLLAAVPVVSAPERNMAERRRSIPPIQDASRRVGVEREGEAEERLVMTPYVRVRPSCGSGRDFW